MMARCLARRAARADADHTEPGAGQPKGQAADQIRSRYARRDLLIKGSSHQAHESSRLAPLAAEGPTRSGRLTGLLSRPTT